VPGGSQPVLVGRTLDMGIKKHELYNLRGRMCVEKDARNAFVEHR
jgi:hypothetical protein